MENQKSLKTAKTSEQKQWAREHLVGLEPLLWPIFSPDFKSLDEEGIRNDVRNSIRHGFCSVFCMGIGVTQEQYRRMIEVICDEANGKIGVGASASGTSLENDIEMIAFCEKTGCTYLTTGPNRRAKNGPQTEEEYYQAYLSRIETTSLPIILYARVAPDNRRFGIDGVPINLFNRLADLANVVAVKVSQPVSMTATMQLCEATCDRLIIGPTNLDFVPILAKHYHQQWSGLWNVEAVQSPEKPYGVEMMKLFGQGKYEEAMKVFDIIEPLHTFFLQLQTEYIRQANHPWGHNKYYQWVVGGNGGLIKNLHYKNDEVQPLDEKEREKIRNIYHSVGIDTVTAPEEEFIVGKAAYARGVRAKDLPETPYYKL